MYVYLVFVLIPIKDNENIDNLEYCYSSTNNRKKRINNGSEFESPSSGI